MIPPLVFAQANQQSLAEAVARNLGTTAKNSQEWASQPHLDLSESGLSFFHPEARSTNKLLIDFNSGSTGWRVKRANHEKLIKKALERIRLILKMVKDLARQMLFLSLF